jgi:hypothetical protein
VCNFVSLSSRHNKQRLLLLLLSVSLTGLSTETFSGSAGANPSSRQCSCWCGLFLCRRMENVGFRHGAKTLVDKIQFVHE